VSSNTFVRYTRFLFGISVRVVELPEGKNVWFGFAEAQDTEFAGAVTRCCKHISDHLVVTRTQK
jgi:hypothetical protein